MRFDIILINAFGIIVKNSLSNYRAFIFQACY